MILQTPKELLSESEVLALKKRAEEAAVETSSLFSERDDSRRIALDNGIKVTVKPVLEERGSALIRVLVPGMSFVL